MVATFLCFCESFFFTFCCFEHFCWEPVAEMFLFHQHIYVFVHVMVMGLELTTYWNAYNV